MVNRAGSGQQKPATIPAPPLVRIYTIQCLVLLLLAAGIATYQSVVAYSVLLGGLISIVPNAYFARLAFRRSGARLASEVVRLFYRGEAGKFLLTTALFAATFVTVKPINVVALFVTFGLVTLMNWIVAVSLSGYSTRIR